MDTWPQLDTWQFKAAPNSCLKAQGDAMPPYMPLIANPVTSLQLVAQAMLYNWPNVETGCTGTGTQDDPYQLGRVAPQGLGNRFMLGLVTLGDAQRYGLTTAKLQASPGHYVAADDAGIKAALSLASKTTKLRPFDLTQDEIRRSADGVPGLHARLHGGEDLRACPTATAQDVAQFIRVSSTEGQKPGRGNGQLAAGYVPLANSGVTRGSTSRRSRSRTRWPPRRRRRPSPRMTRRSRRRAHRASPSHGVHHRAVLPGDAPPGSTPATEPAAAPDDGTTTVADGALVKTAAVSGGGAGLLVLLIVGCVVAGVGAIVGRTVLSSRGLR